MRGIRVIIAVMVAACAGAATVGAQGAPTAQATKGRVPESDYPKWESLAAGDLSPDGKWVAYELRRVNNSNEMRYRLVGAAGTEREDGDRAAVHARQPVVGLHHHAGHRRWQ